MIGIGECAGNIYTKNGVPDFEAIVGHPIIAKMLAEKNLEPATYILTLQSNPESAAALIQLICGADCVGHSCEFLQALHKPIEKPLRAPQIKGNFPVDSPVLTD